MDKYLKDIDTLNQSINYGEISLTLKRHAGKTTQIGVTTFDKRRFTENAAGVAHLITEIKKMTELGQTGSISFTLMVKSGKIDTVVQQGYQSREYQ